MPEQRASKYKTAVLEILQKHGHATNAELAKIMRVSYPNVNNTTVHRVTARLLDIGLIAQAPSNFDGSFRYDINTFAHDHFVCEGCGGLRDIDVAETLIPKIETALGGCKITGRLVIQGKCEMCNKKEGKL